MITTELRSFQEVFVSLLYPALGLTRATIMHQRMEPFKNLLTQEFMDFIKEKPSNDLLPDRSERSVITYLVEDPELICREFAKWAAGRPKERNIFVKRKPA